jgi:apolipoprotein N-acyltransferase
MRGTLLCGAVAAFLLLGASHVHGALAWIACVPLVIACGDVGRWPRAAAAGAVFGTVVACVGNVPWVAEAMRQYFTVSLPAAVAASVVLGLTCGAVFGCILGLLIWCALRLPRPWALAAVPAVWVTWETLLASVFPYYPWVSLAATQGHIPALLQVVSIVGQAGLSFALAATGTAVGLGVCVYRRRPALAAGYLLAGIGTLALPAAYGRIRLMTHGPGARSGCLVSAVDARIASADLPRDWVLQRYAAISRRALAGYPSVVVWPESALPGYLETDPILLGDLRRWVHSSGMPLIAGGPRLAWTRGWQRQEFNAAFEIRPDGPLQVYDKRQLVPFAEYWPRLLGRRRPAWLAAQDAVAGRRPAIFAAGTCRLGVLICFEADHPLLARELAEAGAASLLVLSNDAHLPPAAVSLELIQARLRAVETGLPVVRAANDGASIAYDAFGRVLETPIGGVLTVRLPPPIWVIAPRGAPVFVGLCWLATALIVARAAWRHSGSAVGQKAPKLSVTGPESPLS